MMRISFFLVFALCQAAFISAKFSKDDCSRDVEGSHACRGHFLVYKYDVSKGECVQAVYGGCNPTNNNFATKAQCESATKVVCKSESFFTKEDCSKSFQESDCGVKIAVFYWDSAKRLCVQGVYGGCNPTRNNFRNIDDCKKYAEPVCKA